MKTIYSTEFQANTTVVRRFTVGEYPTLIRAGGLFEAVPLYIFVGRFTSCGAEDGVWVIATNESGEPLTIGGTNSTLMLTLPGTYMFGNPAINNLIIGDEDADIRVTAVSVPNYVPSCDCSGSEGGDFYTRLESDFRFYTNEAGAALSSLVSTKANQTDLDVLEARVDAIPGPVDISGKADQVDLDATNAVVATKADQTELDALEARVDAIPGPVDISGKADQVDLDATNAVVATKADQVDLDATNAVVATKADQTDLDALGVRVDALPDTPADILAMIVTVDGAGSKLDADTIDGVQPGDYALQFLRSNTQGAARNSLGLVPQSNPIDGAASRLLIQGAYGLGSMGSAPVITALDQVSAATGFYRTATSTTGTFPVGITAGTADANGTMIVQLFDGTSMRQIWFHNNSPEVYTRQATGGVFGPWRKVMTDGNIEGTVVVRNPTDPTIVQDIDGPLRMTRLFSRQAAGGAGTGMSLENSDGTVVGSMEWVAATDAVDVTSPGGTLVLRADGTIAWNTDNLWVSNVNNFSSAGAWFGRTDPVSPVSDGVTSVMIRSDGLISAYRGSAPSLLLGRGNDGQVASFYYGAGTTTVVGSIAVTSTGTSYNQTSDYRLKEDVEAMDPLDAVARIKALKPSTFVFTRDPNRVRAEGFIAHELQEVFPAAVTGVKDGVREEPVYDAEGNETGSVTVPDYQGVDASRLVPVLTSALQEAFRRIEELEAKLAG